MLPMYRNMLLTRLFDRKGVALQRTGQLGTYPSSLGQEATTVGIGAAMAREDVFLCSYRETGTLLVRGVRMSEILLYWGGDERGSDYAGPDAPREDFPIFVPIASQAPQAVGVAYAFKLRREPRVAVCVLGDGGSSKGDFYEALNAAGVWQLPVVFVIVNNQWAISVPRAGQSRARDARAKGNRRRNRRRAGRWQRSHRRARRAREGSCQSSPRRRPTRRRGADVSDERSHDR